jgi:hypothetical protein
MVDSTTLGRTTELIEDGSPEPTDMLDLATTVFACVMSDYVIVPLHGDWIPKSLDGVVLPHSENTIIPTSQEIRQLTLLGTDPVLRSELEGAWKDFFGFPVSLARHWWPEAFVGGGESFNRDFVEVPPGGPSNQEWAERFAAFHTLNYLRRELQADNAGAIYHCTSLRFPPEGVSIGQRMQFRWLADSLLRDVEGREQLQANVAQDLRFTPRIEMPHLLSTVLRRARKRNEVWDEVRELREAFSPVREWLRAHQTPALGDMRPLKSLIEGVSAKHTLGSGVDSQIAQTANVVSSFPAVPTSGGLTLKVLSLLKPAGLIQQAVEAVTRPEVRVLRNYKQGLHKVSQSGSDVARLFGHTLSAAWVEAALRLNKTVNLDSVKFIREL